LLVVVVVELYKKEMTRVELVCSIYDLFYLFEKMIPVDK
jgi:hypothetical protein